MTRLCITCQSCGRTWTVARSASIYERQAVESCPCPNCGAYTLRYQTPDQRPRLLPRPFRSPRWRAA